MPDQTRLDDHCTGHDACGARPLVTASADVYVNGRGAGRVGDLYATHGCDVHPPHQDSIVVGSETVYINGRRAGRIGDPVVIAGAVRDGSGDVSIGG